MPGDASGTGAGVPFGMLMRVISPVPPQISSAGVDPGLSQGAPIAGVRTPNNKIHASIAAARRYRAVGARMALVLALGESGGGPFLQIQQFLDLVAQQH